MSLRIWVLVASVLALGCDEEVPPPAYLYVKDASIVNVLRDIRPFQSVDKLWVVVEGIGEHGIYPTGSKIPIIPTSDSLRVWFFVGVPVNGERFETVIYEACAPSVHTLDLRAGSIDTLRLHFSYRTEVKFPLFEGFEPGSSGHWEVVDTTVGYPLTMRRAKASVMENVRYEGRLRLSVDSPAVLMALNKTVKNEAFKGKEVFLEVSVHNPAIHVAMGFERRSRQGVRRLLNAIVLPDSVAAQWRMFYFRFTPVIDAEEESLYRYMFFARLDTTQATVAELGIDNIKVVAF